MIRTGLLVAALTLVVCQAERNPYSLQSNKYGDLLIAISEDVPEDLNLVQKIKDGFTLMSRDLFVATRRRAYLGNATILIPYSWSRRPEWELASTESFEIANVIIDKANPLAGNNPYVNQPGKCAEPGEYMHLTPKYLTDRRLARQWGPTGKTILHEFGHLRWGFFDEYPIPEQGYPRYYHTIIADGSAVVEPVRCSKKTTGENKHETSGQSCTTNPTTALPEDSCNFFPPRNKRAPATGSLMFWHFMHQTVGFCDNDPADENNYHNAEAPNKHNTLCEGRSQWEIMREHVDFKGNNPAIAESAQVDTTPDFKIVQRGAPRIVLLMDVSYSMTTNDRLAKANQAVTEYLRSAVEIGTWIGLVTFSTTTNVTHDLIEIVDENSRQSLIDALPSVATGSTAIGQGLLTAIELLETRGSARGGKILLVSDGVEMIEPFISVVKPNVTEKGVIIDTIRYTENADEQLLSLAAGTGGMSFFSSDADGATGLNDALTKTITDRQQKTSFVQVFSDTFTLKQHSNHTFYILMDSDIGSNSEFVITTTASTRNFAVSLFSPGNSAVAHRNFDKSNIERITVTGIADPGKWRLFLNNPSSTEYQLQISVTSRAKSPDAKPIVLTSSLSSNVVDFNDTKNTEMIIYATLKKGYTPVVRAKVFAIIESSKNTYTQQLLDNGAGADTTKDDGVYSGFFIQMDGNGEYSVKIKVDDNSGDARLKSGEVVAAQESINVGYFDGNETEKVVVILIPIDNLSRSTSSGFFNVANKPPGSDLFAPGKIQNLERTTVDTTARTVTLQWTAVGDDLDQGQASKYDLRMAPTIADLRNNFDKATRIEKAHGVDLSSPKLSGHLETFIIKLDKIDQEIFHFAVRAIDDENKHGPLSNVVSASFKTPAVLERYMGIDPPSDETHGLTTGAIVGIAVAGAVVLVALIVATGCYMSIKKKGARVNSEAALNMYG